MELNHLTRVTCGAVIDPTHSSASTGSPDTSAPEPTNRHLVSDPTIPIGVGPHPDPWPTDGRLDPELLAEGDRRNVGDEYRYWELSEIVADLDRRRHRLHIAIQNWEHDFNIGSMVRTANAFNVAAVHIIGRRRWNRRGAMVTDRYLHVNHHADVEHFADWLAQRRISIIGVDNLPGSVRLETTQLPRDCCLVFGSEGPGLTDEMLEQCERLVAITQYGSTRSINAGAAAAIAMYQWTLQHSGETVDVSGEL